MMDRVFGWAAPVYEQFDDDRFELLIQRTTEKAAWVTMWDQPVPALSDFLSGFVHLKIRAKPVYIYSNVGTTRLVLPHQKLADVPIPRLEGEIEEPLRIVQIEFGQYNVLRSQYMPITLPASASSKYHYVILSGSQMIGACSFQDSMARMPWDLYKMSDFAVVPTVYDRLAKLVIMAVLSTEMQTILQVAFGRRIRTIGTTAFTQNPVSMKYRGIFNLHDRKPGRLNYVGQAGRWSLQEALALWQKNHSQMGQSRKLTDG